MNDEIIKDQDRLSICCGAPLYSDMDICSDCKEHSGVEPVFCHFIAMNATEEEEISNSKKE